MPARSAGSRRSRISLGDPPATRASVVTRNCPPITAAARSTCKRAVVERREAAADRVAHAAGQRQRVAGGAIVVQASLRGEQLDELVDEERVARARVVHRGHEPRGDAGRVGGALPARPRGGQASDLLAREPLQRQPQRRACEAAERRRELRAGVRLVVAVGRDHEDREVGQRAIEELERHERGDVGPVQVVEHDDERPARGRRRQQRRERVEEAKARLIGVEVRGHRGWAERARELGEQPGDPRCRVAERDAQRGDVLVARQRSGDLHPRPVRGGAAAVPAGRPGPRGSARDACSTNARARAVLPIPGSPVTSTTRPRRSMASLSAASSCSSSRPRPTSVCAAPMAHMIPERRHQPKVPGAPLNGPLISSVIQPP